MNKEQLAKVVNDPKIQAHVIGIITRLKKEKVTDTEILAIGVLITKLQKERVMDHGDDGRK